MKWRRTIVYLAFRLSCQSNDSEQSRHVIEVFIMQNHRNFPQCQNFNFVRKTRQRILFDESEMQTKHELFSMPCELFHGKCALISFEMFILAFLKVCKIWRHPSITPFTSQRTNNSFDLTRQPQYFFKKINTRSTTFSWNYSYTAQFIPLKKRLKPVTMLENMLVVPVIFVPRQTRLVKDTPDGDC